MRALVKTEGSFSLSVTEARLILPYRNPSRHRDPIDVLNVKG